MSLYTRLIKPLNEERNAPRPLRTAFIEGVRRVFEGSQVGVSYNQPYGYHPCFYAQFTISLGSAYMYFVLSDSAGSNGGSTGWGSRSSSNESYIYFSSTGREVNFNASAIVGDSEGEEAISKLMDWFKQQVRPEPVRGCIKVFNDIERTTWTYRRTNNPHVIKIGDEYFWNENRSNYAFVRFYRENTEDFEWMFRSNVPLNSHNYRGNFYAPDVLTPVYDAFDSTRQQGQYISSYMPESVLIEGSYRFYETPNGRVYTSEPVPYRNYNTKPIWNYSARIENILEETDLFRLGSTDLYRHREKDIVPFLGWELEACCNTSEVSFDDTTTAIRQALDKLVVCKQDASIAPTGFETVSVPATLDFWKEAPITEALNKLRSKPYNMRSYEHQSCGFHVHVSRAALSVLDLQKIERFMHNPANRNFLVAVAGRGSNSYAAYNEKLFNGRNRNRSGRNPKSDGLNVCVHNAPWIRTVSGVNRGFTGARALSHLIYSCISINKLSCYETVYQVYDGYRDPTPEDEQSIINGVIEHALQIGGDDLEFWKLALKTIFPDRTFDFNGAVSSGEHSWKAGLRKSKLSASRKENYNTSRLSPGPVGKGEARYDVLNTKNKNTVEFRLFKGTMNPDSIYRYLEFVDALVRFVPTTSATDEGVDFNKFIAFIKNDSFNRARYSTLLAFLISKEFISRKEIRKREIKELVEADNVIEGEVVKLKPNPAVVESEDDNYFDDDPLEDCECPDCRPDLHEDYYYDEDR